MSDSVNNGGSAFPYWRSWENERKGYTEHDGADGMSLRDYFAAKAMAAHLARMSNAELANACQKQGVDPGEYVAVLAYECADAMLKARDAL